MQAVLFDLDGTLIDTAPDIAAALNLALQRQGLRAASLEQVRGWIGDGTRASLAKAVRAAGVPEAEIDGRVDTLWPGFHYDYAQCCGEHSRVYPGVRRLLERLTGAGIQVGLVTNKEAAFAHRLLVRHDLNACFDLMVCGDTLPVRKPDPAMLLHALNALQCSADDALYVGDSALDVRTARAAGVTVWAVEHGYGGPLRGDDAPDRLVENFDELARALTTHRGLRVSIF
ncbi:MAG TPA: phosphoglycolate phosphatase [Burkholderiaceae bacterium]|nr:phosphoglycolate phosphatase [Burkholderiaceae bacterium]